MKISANRKVLADALAWVGQAIAARPANPILGGIRLTVDDSALTVSAYDYDRSHAARIAVEVGEPGECLVMGGFVRSIVAAMAGTTVDLGLDESSLSIAAGRATYKARTLELGNYPDLPAFPAVVGTADADDLLDGIGVVEHAVDDSISQPEAIRGLRILGSNELVFVATDRYRIATTSLPWTWAADLRVTVPARGFESAVKGMTGVVTIGHQEGSFGLRDETRAVTLRTHVDGFPEAWERLVAPADGAQTITVDSADLRGALKRAELGSEGLTTVTWAPGELVLRGQVEAGEGDDAITAETEGTGRVGFNPRYLADALAAIPGGPITIHAAPRGAWVIQAADHPHMTFTVNSKRLPQEAR